MDLLERALGVGREGQVSSARLVEDLVISGKFDGASIDLPPHQRIARVNNLGLAYRLLGRLDQDPILRDAAVAARRLSLRLSSDDETKRLAAATLAEDLRIRWELHHNPKDLAEAIELCRGVAGLDEAFLPRLGVDGVGDVATGNALAVLCTSLRLRYESASDELALTQAIRLGRRAVDLTPRGSNAWHARNNNLALALRDRWLLRRALADIDEAVRAATSAVDDHRQQTSAHVARWSTLGSVLRSRFIHRAGLGAFHPPDPLDLRTVRPTPDIPRDDIDLAVNAFDRAVHLAGLANIDVNRSRLIAALLTRYDIFRERADLERAATVARQIDVGESTQPLVLNDVAYALARAGSDLRRPHQVLEAIELGERALQGLTGSANEAMALDNLGTYFRALEFLDENAPDTSPDVAAYDSAIRSASASYRKLWHQAATNVKAPAWYRLSAARRWAEASYRGLPDDPSSLAAYGVALDLITSVATVGIDRRSREAQLRDLSLVARDAAAAALTAGHPHDAQDVLERGRTVFWSESVNSQRLVAALASTDPLLARRIALVGATLFQGVSSEWHRTLESDQLDTGRDGAAGGAAHSVTSDSGLSRPDDAQRNQIPAMIPSVPSHDEPNLDGSVRTPPPAPAAADAVGAPPWQAWVEPDPVDRRLALAREWDLLLEEVRSLPGFEAFLRPPSHQDLIAAASEGPVVTVNVSAWRCDALVLTSAGVEAVPLPDLTLPEAERRLDQHLRALAAFDNSVTEFEEADRDWQQNVHDPSAIRQRQDAGARRRNATLALDDELTSLVGWLWDVVIVPLLDKLPAYTPDGLRPRVWWCPTGPLAFLPLHAAGRGSQWLHDRVVSSTTPTVRSLLDARTREKLPSRRPAETGRDGGASKRFLVASTFSSTHALLSGPLSCLSAIDIVECSDVDGVRRQLETSDFVHFDCHGDQVLAEPSQGGVRLADGVLRVFDVSSISAAGEFAGLAACKTAVGGVDLLDEAITLSAALHYAGFRHVVGTLWNLAENVAQAAFADMYVQLATDDGDFDPGGSARALADAVDRLRLSGESLHAWASLIHIGP